MLKCLLAAVSLERNANPVIHLFHLGEVAVAALASSEVLCILTTLQRHLGGLCQVANQQSHSSPQHWAKSNYPCGDWQVWWGLVHHHSHLPCSPFLGSFLVNYAIALDSAGQTGVRDGLQMDSRSLQWSAGIGFDPGSDLRLLVQLWEGNTASMAFPAHCLTGGCQMVLSLNFIYNESVCHMG